MSDQKKSETASGGNEAAAIAEQLREKISAMPQRGTPVYRAVRKEFSRRLTDADASLVLDVARDIADGDDRAPRFVAFELVRDHPEALKSVGMKELKELAGTLDSWGAVDSFCITLAGPVWKTGGISDDDVAAWATSDDRWWRRAAVVATVPLNAKAEGGEGDPERTLAVIRLLVDDRDDMVVKAISWALRELATQDRQAVRDFIEELGQKLAPRIRREVRNKLDTGIKHPGR